MMDTDTVSPGADADAEAPRTNETHAATTSGARPLGAKESVARFVERGVEHYSSSFARIQRTRRFSPTFNAGAALLVPIWAGARGVWGFFWVAALLELVVLTQLCRGRFGDLGARADRLMSTMESRRAAAETALAAGNDDQAAIFTALANNHECAVAAARDVAEQAAVGATGLIVFGLVGFNVLRVV